MRVVLNSFDIYCILYVSFMFSDMPHLWRNLGCHLRKWDDQPWRFRIKNTEIPLKTERNRRRFLHASIFHTFAGIARRLKLTRNDWKTITASIRLDQLATNSSKAAVIASNETRIIENPKRKQDQAWKQRTPKTQTQIGRLWKIPLWKLSIPTVQEVGAEISNPTPARLLNIFIISLVAISRLNATASSSDVQLRACSPRHAVPSRSRCRIGTWKRKQNHMKIYIKYIPHVYHLMTPYIVNPTYDFTFMCLWMFPKFTIEGGSKTCQGVHVALCPRLTHLRQIQSNATRSSQTLRTSQIGSERWPRATQRISSRFPGQPSSKLKACPFEGRKLSLVSLTVQ